MSFVKKDFSDGRRDLMDDQSELSDPALQHRIKANMKAYHAGRGRPVREFLAELKQQKPARQ